MINPIFEHLRGEVEVRLDEKQAIITAENVSNEEIIDAIEEVGYEVVEIEEL